MESFRYKRYLSVLFSLYFDLFFYYFCTQFTYQIKVEVGNGHLSDGNDVNESGNING